MSDFTFKQVDKNEYETFMEGNSLNIFFKIPDGCKIEDYKIQKSDSDSEFLGSPSKAAYFEFTKAPDENAMSTISPLAGLNFLHKKYVKIEEHLFLTDNNGVTIDFEDGASPSFSTLNLENNNRFSLFFKKSNFEKLTPKELQEKSRVIASKVTSIISNANLTVTLGDGTLFEGLVSCKSSNNLDLGNKVDLSNVRHLLCRNSFFLTKTNDFTIVVECDSFSCKESTICAEGRTKKSDAICLLKNKYKEKGELNLISLYNTEVEFEGNSSFVADAKVLSFERSPKQRSIIFKKANKMSAKELISLQGARLYNAQINSDNNYATMIDSDLHDATVHFSDAGDEYSNGVIKDADIRYSDLKNINGVLTKELFNCNANNVTLEEESYIKYGSLTRDVKGRWLELENVVLKEQASLYLYDYSNQESPLKKFSNSTIEGKIEIDNDVDYTIESSVLKSGNIKIKAGDKIDKVIIDNTILEGDNVLYNVSELSCSEVRDSELDLKEPAKISNQLLSFEDIDDYEAYQRAQEPKLEEIKKDVGQITTEDWEVL